MKPRARFTPRLNTWAFWFAPYDWIWGTVGYGYSLEDAAKDHDERWLARWAA